MFEIKGDSVKDSERSLPIYKKVAVLVVGSGSAGLAAVDVASF